MAVNTKISSHRCNGEEPVRGINTRSTIFRHFTGPRTAWHLTLFMQKNEHEFDFRNPGYNSSQYTSLGEMGTEIQTAMQIQRTQHGNKVFWMCYGDIQLCRLHGKKNVCQPHDFKSSSSEIYHYLYQNTGLQLLNCCKSVNMYTTDVDLILKAMSVYFSFTFLQCLQQVTQSRENY